MRYSKKTDWHNLYSLGLTDNAKKDLDKLDKPIKTFILKSLKEFINNFSDDYERELIKTTKIKSLKGDFDGLYRLRLRTYRIIYVKGGNELTILIVRISHRKDAYE